VMEGGEWVRSRRLEERVGGAGERRLWAVRCEVGSRGWVIGRLFILPGPHRCVGERVDVIVGRGGAAQRLVPRGPPHGGRLHPHSGGRQLGARRPREVPDTPRGGGATTPSQLLPLGTVLLAFL